MKPDLHRVWRLIPALLLCAAPLHAQDLRISFEDGHVTLVANGVTVRDIMAAWARVGGTMITGGEQLGGPAVTLDLRHVPEADALQALLQSASGYVAAPRRSPAPGLSSLHRLVIVAASGPPENPGGAAPAAAAGRVSRAPGPTGPVSGRSDRPNFDRLEPQQATPAPPAPTPSPSVPTATPNPFFPPPGSEVPVPASPFAPSPPPPPQIEIVEPK